ncbi:MAG: hypothetical protein B7Z66_05775 [Chromatiales bacterium 21-64-14]|nr:MAG: hypothetical protein B7Z66_05775 [Chromatiales bacterium 21-64-14]HQU15188.1 alkaline phosphatase family protein [Gammaproteobacteria bacterium]
MQQSKLRWKHPFGLLAVALAVLGGIPLVAWSGELGGTPPTLPRPDHVVIVIEENHAYDEIVGNPDAPYINALAARGALFNRSYAVTHPSEPNYLALFSGSTQGLRSDSCPHTYTGRNLASELVRRKQSFATYSESMPAVGYTGCHSGDYYRKHNPAVNWQGVNVRKTMNLPFTRFPTNFDALPTVSLVIPNAMHDMHDGTVRQGDRWLRKHLDAYVRWAQNHNSLLILTWDEDDRQSDNHIPTLFVGPMVTPGVYPTPIDHYRVLRTLEDLYGLAPLGHSAQTRPIHGIWVRGAK